jgi:acetyl-CoA/propionyl-CoA carboxylase biotin carboxyl carrier protein
LPWTQDQIAPRGHAIECRINAEDVGDNFRPSLGTLATYREPAGYGVRVDAGYGHGDTIPQFYDSLIAKLVTWGADRGEAIVRMQRALADFAIDGVRTTIPFHQHVMGHAVFTQGEATIRFIGQHVADADLKALPQSAAGSASNGEADADAARTFHVEVNGRRFAVRVAEQNGESQPHSAAPQARRTAKRSDRAQTSNANAITSPMQGTVVAVRATPGMAVEAGQVLFVVEAMKMENEITAPRAGTVKDVAVVERAAVQAGQTLATLE